MSGYSLDDLLCLMARLRDPVDGCPWDLAQTFSSIAPHTIEESYELLDAIQGENFQHIKEELGDVLFQVVFYSQLAKEQGEFEFSEIVSTLVDKLIRRHPHVFPAATLTSRSGEQNITSVEIKNTWESIKSSERLEKNQQGILDDVPLALPALTRAAKLQKRASRVGFDWSKSAAVLNQLKLEIAELEEAMQSSDDQHILEELGDVLFSTVNLARHLQVDPESALRQSNHKFERRFRFIESALLTAGSSPQQATLEKMDELWDEAKMLGL